MTKTIITNTALAAMAVFAALAAAPSVFAASPDESVTYKVSTAGLDLRSPQGAEIMLQRIQTAADVVCGEAPISADLNMTYHWRACVSHNVSQAVSQLGSPMVAEVAHPSTATQTASNGR